MRRQQTLRASVDWSHDLLSEPEQVLFRRLAVFFGGFDVDAAQAVAGGADWSATRFSISSRCWWTSRLWLRRTARVEPDIGCWKPCVSTHRRNCTSPARATTCGPRHRDHYTAVAALLDGPRTAAINSRHRVGGHRNGQSTSRFRLEPANERMTQLALALASSLQPLWWDAGARAGRTELAELRACQRQPTERRRNGCARAGRRRQGAALVASQARPRAARRPSRPWQLHGNSATLRSCCGP